MSILDCKLELAGGFDKDEVFLASVFSSRYMSHAGHPEKRGEKK